MADALHPGLPFSVWENLQSVDVICPGFAADCLETLEEIGDELRCAYQLENPDGAFHYIPALNDSDKAVAAYETIIRRELGGWI